jgi:hypothetical protein
MIVNNATLREIGNSLRNQVRVGNINLLSELNLELEEIELIRSSADRLIDSALKGRDTFDIQVAYFMMDIGMRFYDDGTYWTDFWNQVGIEQNQNKQSILGEFFKNTVTKYGLAVAETRGRPYVNIILMHSFIPEKYSDYFFDFVQKYYRVVLKASVPEDLDSQLSVFEEVFSKEHATDAYPELKSVHLIVPTKLVLKKREFYVQILAKIIKRMANDYEFVDDVKLGIYEEPFKKWRQKEKIRKKTKSDINSPPTMRYDNENSELFMNIPPQIMDPNDGLTCFVESSDGQILHRFNITQYSQFHNLISEERDIRLTWDPLDRFVVRIGKRKIYDNENDGVIFFNKNGRKRSKVSLGFNTVIIPKGSEIDIQTSDLAGGNNYAIKGFLMTRGDKVCIRGKMYIIEEEILESLHIISDSLDIECFDQDNNPYVAYSEHPILRLSLSSESKLRLKLSVGRSFHRISYDDVEDLSKDIFVTQDEQANYLIDLSKKGLSVENGIYSIRYRGRDVYKYVLLKDFKYNFEKELYESDEDSQLYCTGCPNGIMFNTVQGVVELPKLNSDGRELSIQVQVPSRRFSFDMKTWILFNSKELYFRDVEKRQVYIYCPTLVFPRITVNYDGSKPLVLEIEGQYLTCEFKKVVQIGHILEMGHMYMPSMSFKCGRFDLFTIRYTANYELSSGSINRTNAPKNTHSLCKYESGKIIPFDGDSIILPSDVVESVDVYECYDTAFSEEMRFAFHPNTRPRLRTGGDIIWKGETPKELKVDFNGETVTYGRELIDYLICIDTPYDADHGKCFRNQHSMNTKGSSVELYDSVCGLIRDVILSDESTERLKRRIQRFKDGDPEFATKLCERHLELRSDRDVIHQLSHLRQVVKDKDKE